MSAEADSAALLARERDYWDHYVPPLEDVIEAFEEGPDVWIGAIVDAAERNRVTTGHRVLDFGCGTGLLAAHLAARGFEVTAVDISPVSLARATGLRDHLGLDFRVVEGVLDERPLADGELVDLLVGNNALHHLDLERYGPLLRSTLAPGGRAIFVESMATNPALMFTRRHLVGRFGIPRFGTADEHPLTLDDLEQLGALFGGVERTLPEMVMFRLVSRHLLRGRLRPVHRALGRMDDVLGRREALQNLSFRALVQLGPTPD